MSPFARTRQCKACPFKVSTNPHAEIPHAYDPEKHRLLLDCNPKTGRIMACHESPANSPYACVGWLVHQLDEGNNVLLRFRAIRGEFDPKQLVVEGEQHTSLEAMCATSSTCGRSP